jgi:hypothetical protein
MSITSTVRRWLEDESLYDYFWEAGNGDDRNKREHDSKLINRNQGYEVLEMLVDLLDELELEANNSNLTTLEFMIQDSDARSREFLFDEIVAKMSE